MVKLTSKLYTLERRRILDDEVNYVLSKEE